MTTTRKKLKVKFLGPVSHGFKHDTPGFEATENAQGGRETTIIDFAEGDEFEFPAEEHDEAQLLIDKGVAEPA